MKTKPILCPERLRHVPKQFSWIDQRLVRERHIRGRTPRALALYLFLCTVADAQGASYYSDTKTGELLGFAGGELREARMELVKAGLIAYGKPFYQVLSLEPREGGSLLAPEQPRIGQARSIGEILRSMMEAP
jgi:hypothetical protein